MPVLDKGKLSRLNMELTNRYDTLRYAVMSRSLKYINEGADRGGWRDTEDMSATIGDASEIRMACDDFKTILSEIRRLK